MGLSGKIREIIYLSDESLYYGRTNLDILTRSIVEYEKLVPSAIVNPRLWTRN